MNAEGNKEIKHPSETLHTFIHTILGVSDLRGTKLEKELKKKICHVKNVGSGAYLTQQSCLIYSANHCKYKWVWRAAKVYIVNYTTAREVGQIGGQSGTGSGLGQ